MSTKPLDRKYFPDADRAGLYAILISNLKDYAIFLMDGEGCIESWNPGVEKIFGYREAEWVARSADIIFTPEERASGKLQRELYNARTLGQATEVCRQVRRDGSLTVVQQTTSALRNGAGELLGFSKVIQHHNERQQQDQKLDARLYAQGMVETIPQPLLAVDDQCVVQFANAAFCGTFRLRKDEVEGQSIYLLGGGEWDFPQLRLLLESVLPDQPATEAFELEHTFRELGHKTLRVNGRRIAYEGSETELTVLAIEDITQRRQAEKALAASEKHRRLIMDGTPALIGYIDSDLRYRMANKAYERWFGVAPEKLVGRTVEELFGSSFAQNLQPHIRKVLSGETTGFEADFPSLGGLRTIQVTYTPDVNQGGTVNGFIVLGSDISSRKEAEIALRKSEERWRNLFESMAEGFFIGEMIYDADEKAVDFRFVEVNSVFESLTGLRDAAGETMRGLIPEIPDDLIERYAEVLRTGDSAHFETVIPALRDSWYEVRAYRTEKPRFAVLFLNITERKAAEAQLLRNEQRQAALVTLGDRLRDLHEIGPLTSAAMEITGTALGLTRAGYGQVDGSQEFLTVEKDWTNGRVATLAGTYRFEDFGEDLGGSLRRGETFVAPDVMTHPMTSRDSDRWKALDIRAVINLPLFESGKLVAVLFIQDSVPRHWTESEISFLRKVADRTWAAAERARALKELQESESFTRSVLASSPDCIKVMDMEGRLLTINEGGCQQMEIGDLSGCLNRPWLDFWAYARDEAAEAFAKAKQGLTQRFEGFCPTAKGTPKWWEVVVSPIRDLSGEPIRILSLSRDITERKADELERERLTQELQRSNEDLSQFAHTVAHDLQSPLRGVTVFAQLLQRNAGTRISEKDAEFLEHIVISARRMSELVQGLLRFAQVGQGRIEKRGLSMMATVDAVLRNLHVQIDEQAAVVRYGELPVVKGDAVQLSQLLQNLVGNALKYRRPGLPPEVSISAVREGSFHRFSVCDNGEGIGPEHLKSVFEPMRRLHGADVPGTGLGLSVCERIVNRHGGRIWVESDAGKGSCFFFTLPAE